MKRFIQSIGNALSGIQAAWKQGGNFKIQVALGFMALGLGILLKINATEWFVILLFTSGVLSLETFNSSLEALCDTITTEQNKGIKTTKDFAAGAVLLFSIGAFIAGLIIFIPKLWILFFQ
ncbi:MAG: diacylglycerol kinase family protein [Bacteroidetes bacterium]|nr:diacylglycerol kinase family protein [Bacteroidota bacterium]